MSFVAHLLERLEERPELPFVTEVHHDRLQPATGRRLAALIAAARARLRARGVAKGDRVVLLAENSIGWVACDLAILAEGAIVVPMYARQAVGELVAMMHDCAPTLVLCGTPALRDAVAGAWPEAPVALLEEVLRGEPVDAALVPLDPDDVVTIIYTSGTSGVPKGVMLTRGNVDFMLEQTKAGLEDLMFHTAEPHRVFHYLPVCFAGSRITLWTCLFRGNGVMFSTDLDDLVTEMKAAGPNYYLNVPVLLERVKNGVEARIAERAWPVRKLWSRGKRAFLRDVAGEAGKRDAVALAVARRVVFAKVRAQIGPNLVCLICGSAPLGEDTQRWFEMLGIPVYQVYGLTETTAIVSMDKPRANVPGRVGLPLAGVDVKLGADDELLVRGPNVFAGYWGRPDLTEEAFADGWFRTGDQVVIHEDGSLQIVGRTKNLLVPTSGHNVAPEPIEQKLVETIDGVEHVVLVGHGRPWIGALVAGDAPPERIQAAIDAVNAALPGYRRVRAFRRVGEPFTIENGLLTATSKLRRSEIERRFAGEIEAMYAE